MRPFNFMDSKRKQGNIYMSSDKHILNAMTGDNANVVIANKTAFIQVINSKLRSVNAQKLPIGFDLTKRRLVLNKNIFTHKANKDELYIFNPLITYTYDEANATCKATEIDYDVIFSSPDKMADFLEKLISPLVNGNASSIMAGDIAKAYPKKVGTLNSLKYTLKGELYSDDEHILEAIRNSNVVSCINADHYDQFDIKQGINANQDTFVYTGTLDNVKNVMYFEFDDSDIISADDDYAVALAEALAIDSDTPRRDFYHTNILDIKSDNPTKYDIMAETRFKVNRHMIIEGKLVDGDDAITTTTVITGCGTEIINELEFIFFYGTASYAANNVEHRYYGNVFKPQWLDCMSTYGGAANSYVMNFRYFPYVPYRTLLADIDSNNYDYFAGWCMGRGNYNMRIITQWELDQLNIASFGSLLLTEDDKINDNDLA
nr:putative capsid protein [Picobirnavirus sp.]